MESVSIPMPSIQGKGCLMLLVTCILEASVVPNESNAHRISLLQVLMPCLSFPLMAMLVLIQTP